MGYNGYKRRRPEWLTFRGSCIPCIEGKHHECRHTPNEGPHGPNSEHPDGTPCGCETRGHPDSPVCGDWRSRDWSFVQCDNTAREFMEQVSDGVTYRAPLCGVHARGIRTRQANDARWQAAWAARDEEAKARSAAERASDDWAARLRDEFKIHASGLPGSTHKGLLVGVEPEHLYGLLAELAGVLRDVGAPWPETP